MKLPQGFSCQGRSPHPAEDACPGAALAVSASAAVAAASADLGAELSSRQAWGEGPAAVAQMTVAWATAGVAASGVVVVDLGQAALAVQAGGVAQVGLAAEAVQAGPAVLVSSAEPAGANMQS